MHAPEQKVRHKNKCENGNEHHEQKVFELALWKQMKWNNDIGQSPLVSVHKKELYQLPENSI